MSWDDFFYHKPSSSATLQCKLVPERRFSPLSEALSETALSTGIARKLRISTMLPTKLPTKFIRERCPGTDPGQTLPGISHSRPWGNLVQGWNNPAA